MGKPYDIHVWITESLPRRLDRDLNKGRIHNEADLHCCVYFHMRAFLHKRLDPRWRTQNKPAVLGGWKESAKFPDIVIAYANQPRYALELKDLRFTISSDSIYKDRQKLRLIAQRMESVNKGYFLYLIGQGDWEDWGEGFYSGYEWESGYYFEVPVIVD